MTSKQKTIAVAESCTGGLLSARLTQKPGSSDTFLGGVVAYHNRAKSHFLGVSPFLIKKEGAVSASVAKRMAIGARRRFKSDLGLSITGIAGPSGGSLRKPVGLVYIAISDAQKTRVYQHFFHGNRSQIRAQAVARALKALRLRLAQ
ncbi:MAG: nicotinamide-nucleotide amidohydrolase family protein [Candidatus Omnitrophica bacterium]|nr:nicotinamide-nucleotide amidohydrolase family protein [Candidatus Omnitrophota bacterium]